MIVLSTASTFFHFLGGGGGGRGRLYGGLGGTGTSLCVGADASEAYVDVGAKVCLLGGRAFSPPHSRFFITLAMASNCVSVSISPNGTSFNTFTYICRSSLLLDELAGGACALDADSRWVGGDVGGGFGGPCRPCGAVASSLGQQSSVYTWGSPLSCPILTQSVNSCELER